MTPPPPSPSGSRYEADEEVLRAIQAASGWVATQSPTDPVTPPAPPPAPEPAQPPARGGLAAPFRPTHRPPVAFLTVCDDGRPDGEVVRLRGGRFVVGRTDGDLLLPHDELVTGRHVEITRQSVGGAARWVVTDLQSTNGLFVRVSRAALNDRSEFLAGGGRYRFEGPAAGPATADYLPGEGGTGATRGWAAEPTAGGPPALSDLVAGGVGNRYVLSRPEYWIGTDPACPIHRPHDPFCEPRHARVYHDAAGGWHVEHRKTANGLWLRVPQITTEKGCQFQIGEQRLRLSVKG